MANQFLIKKHGLEEEVLKLRAKGLGASLIAKGLSEKTGQKFSKEVITNFLTRDAKTKGEVIMAEKKYQKELVNKEFNILKKMEWADAELTKALEETDEIKDYQNWIRIMAEIRKWTELRLRITGKLHDSAITFNQTNINAFDDFKEIVFEVLKDRLELQKEIEKKLYEKLKIVNRRPELIRDAEIIQL